MSGGGDSYKTLMIECKVENRREISRWDDNINRSLTEKGCENVGWIGLAQSRVQWQALMNRFMNFGVP